MLDVLGKIGIASGCLALGAMAVGIIAFAVDGVWHDVIVSGSLTVFCKVVYSTAALGGLVMLTIGAGIAVWALWMAGSGGFDRMDAQPSGCAPAYGPWPKATFPKPIPPPQPSPKRA